MKRSLAILFLLFAIGACSLEESITDEEPTLPNTKPTITSKIVPSTEKPAPNTATLRAEEAVTPTLVPTRLPTSTPNLTPIVEVPCNDLKKQIPLDFLNELTITYVNGGAVFIWRGLDCSVQQLTNFENIRRVRVLEDKGTIIFEKSIPYEEFRNSGIREVWAMNLDGSDQRLLIDAAELESFYNERGFDSSQPYEFFGLELQKVVSIPNSDLILFGTQIIVTSFPDWSKDLRLLNIKTGEITTVFKAKQAGEFFLSPDATKVAITSPTSLSVYDFTTGKLTPNLLTFEIPAYGAHCCFYAKPIWAADSSRFRVSIPPEEPEANGALVTLWEIDVSTFITREINKYPGMQPLRFNQSLTPNLQHFALYSEGQLHVHEISSRDTTNPIFTGDLRLIDWNPNSINFLFSVGEDLFVGHLAQDPTETNAPRYNGDLDTAFWINEQYFVYVYQVRDSGDSSLNIRLGSVDGTSMPLLSLPEDSITSLSVKRIP